MRANQSAGILTATGLPPPPPPSLPHHPLRTVCVVERVQIVEDLVRCYGGGKTGRTIVFVERKASADELANAIGESTGARALHGDISQVSTQTTHLPDPPTPYPRSAIQEKAGRGMRMRTGGGSRGSRAWEEGGWGAWWL